ncbi:hypothetical protein WH5701_08524 [Synechococcus sp. WH 5701]|nr:hypothetical protein WH5701_08524 [Synechococcus sp. WH 5701]
MRVSTEGRDQDSSFLRQRAAPGWLELTAAELQGHTTAERYARIEPEEGSGKPTYKRQPWPQPTSSYSPAGASAASYRA